MPRIRVRLNQSGQTGTIEENEFDESIYTRLEAEQGPLEKFARGGAKALPILGAILGGSLGLAGGPVGAAAGAGIGGGLGSILGQKSTELLDRPREGQPLGGLTGFDPRVSQEQFAEAGQEAGISAASQLVMGPVFKILGKGLAPVAEFAGKRAPEFLTRLSISEPGKQLQKTLAKKLGQEVSGEALGEIAERPARELAEGIVEKGITGSAKSLAKQGIREISEKIPGSIGSQIKTAVANIPGKPDTTNIVLRAMAKAAETVPGQAGDDALLS